MVAEAIPVLFHLNAVDNILGAKRVRIKTRLGNTQAQQQRAGLHLTVLSTEWWGDGGMVQSDGSVSGPVSDYRLLRSLVNT